VSYATASDLMAYAGADELAQVATPTDLSVVTGALMRLTVDAGDRSAFTAPEIAAADAALVNINQSLTDASEIVDGHLEARYTLPLSPVPKVLRVFTMDLARFRLHDQNAPDEVSGRYKTAAKFLENLAKGAITLGAGDPNQGADAPQFTPPSRVFDADTLSDFA